MLHNYNGTYSENISINITNRSFLYGDGFFESIRIFNCQIFNKNNHHNRIQYALSKLNLKLEISIDELFLQLEVLAKKNKVKLGGLARISIFRNEGGLYTPTTTDCSYLIKAEPVLTNIFELSGGIKTAICDGYIKPQQPLSSLKSSSALTYVMAALEKKNRGLDELILLNQASNVVEGTNSNIFIVKNDQIITPPIQDGAVNGTMRALLLNCFNIHEKTLVESDLIKADEIFFTNFKGLRWVKHLKNHSQYCSKKSVEINRFLNSLI